MRTSSLLTIAACCGLAFVVGRYTARDKAPPATAPAPAEVHPVATAPAAAIHHLRDELAGACTTGTAVKAAPAVEPAHDEPTKPEASADQLAARDRALALVDTAVTTGRWTEADRNQMHTLLATTGPLVDDVYARLIPEINAGHLTVEVMPPL